MPHDGVHADTQFCCDGACRQFGQTVAVQDDERGANDVIEG